MKKRFAVLVLLVCGLLCLAVGAQAQTYYVGSYEELVLCLSNMSAGDSIRLTDDITCTDDIMIAQGMSINLDGHTLTLSSGSNLIIDEPVACYDGTVNASTAEPTATPTAEPTSTPTATPVPITIVKQPTDFGGQEGQKGTVSVEATGGDLSYQWYVDRDDGEGFVPCQGATDSTYTISDLQTEWTGYQYYCQVSNGTDSLRSNIVTLTVEGVIPKTGDGFSLSLWFALTMASCAGMVYLLRRNRWNPTK